MSDDLLLIAETDKKVPMMEDEIEKSWVQRDFGLDRRLIKVTIYY